MAKEAMKEPLLVHNRSSPYTQGIREDDLKLWLLCNQSWDPVFDIHRNLANKQNLPNIKAVASLVSSLGVSNCDIPHDSHGQRLGGARRGIAPTTVY